MKKKRAEAQAPPAAAGEQASRSSSPVLNATAGAIAGCVSRFVVGPLDVLKIRFQVQLEPIVNGAASRAAHSHYTSVRQALVTIVKEEGIQGLWRGTVPGQLLTIPYTAVQFVALHRCKELAAELGAGPGSAWSGAASFISGAAAGAAGTVASYPFDLLRTTLAAQGEPPVYRGMLDAASGIVRQAGPGGLYRGLGVTLVEIVPYAALQFGLYDAFLRAYDSTAGRPDYTARGGAPTSVQALVCGLAAGTIAKLATHPLDVVKKRFQVAGLQRSARYGARVAPEAVTSLRECVRRIYTQEGAAGFYKGALPSVAKAAPAAAVTFMAYGLALRLLTQLYAPELEGRGALPAARPLH